MDLFLLDGNCNRCKKNMYSSVSSVMKYRGSPNFMFLTLVVLA